MDEHVHGHGEVQIDREGEDPQLATDEPDKSLPLHDLEQHKYEAPDDGGNPQKPNNAHPRHAVEFHIDQ